MRPQVLLWTISGKRALNIFGSDPLRLAVNVRYDGSEGNLRPTTAAAAQTVLQLIVEIVQYMLDSTLHDRDYEVRLLGTRGKARACGDRYCGLDALPGSLGCLGCGKATSSCSSGSCFRCKVCFMCCFERILRLIVS